MCLILYCWISSFYGVFSCPFGDALFNFCRAKYPTKASSGTRAYSLSSRISEFGFSTREDQKTFKRQKNELLIMKLEDIERALL